MGVLYGSGARVKTRIQVVGTSLTPDDLVVLRCLYCNQRIDQTTQARKFCTRKHMFLYSNNGHKPRSRNAHDGPKAGE